MRGGHSRGGGQRMNASKTVRFSPAAGLETGKFSRPPALPQVFVSQARHAPSPRPAPAQWIRLGLAGSLAFRVPE